MARAPRARRPSQSGDNRNARIEMAYVDINSIQPYPYNPRDNRNAIASLANSIKNFGFLIPVVIDGDNVLVAGHTRVEAAKTLGLAEVPAVQAEHLSEEQINAFRLIDNKVAEIAQWDFDMLSGELNKLAESGIDFTDYGWTREELDCLSDVVRDDCLSTEELVTDEQRTRLANTERRAPTTARFVLGEIVFFISAEQYRNWVDEIRTTCDYDEQEIQNEIMERLRIPE